ncbi:MAG TPA: GNAT family N-acetyltransferase [Terriglobales bacterium]|nr:GNAT family N-acetyltransferase [Terriglobales bacterium]
MADITVDPGMAVSRSPLPLPLASESAPTAWRAEWYPHRDWAPLLPAWRASQQCYGWDDLGAHPDWCRGLEEVYPGSVQLLLLYRRHELAAVVPLIVKRMELDCHLGELHLAQFRPRVAQLAGAFSGLPQNEPAFRAFFDALLRRSDRPRGERQRSDRPRSERQRSDRPRIDAVRFALPTDSPLWAYLASPDFARFGLRRYQPNPPAPHHLIHLPPTLQDYFAKFTPKTRKNRFRELKYLEQRGPVELAQFSRPDQVDPFLAAASALSCRSYQHKLLKAGLRAPDQLRRRLQVAAEHGWLRSYVLRCAGTDCSYMLGYQFHGRYHYTKVGYDPDWAKLCVGTVLQLLVLHDLYARDTPAVFDFGPQGPQKQYFGNDSFLEGDVFFFRPGLYPWLARTSHRSSRRLTARTGALLDRFQLKPRAQRLLRRLAGC